jgi:multisubunit Na+/H+ antiporter MnhC subunit
MKTIQKNYDSNTMFNYAYLIISIFLMIGFYLLLSNDLSPFVSAVPTNADSASLMITTDF